MSLSTESLLSRLCLINIYWAPVAQICHSPVLHPDHRLPSAETSTPLILMIILGKRHFHYHVLMMSCWDSSSVDVWYLFWVVLISKNVFCSAIILLESQKWVTSHPISQHHQSHLWVTIKCLISSSVGSSSLWCQKERRRASPEYWWYWKCKTILQAWQT